MNANNIMGALASRNESLAETVFILPTFLDESRATVARLREFAVDTRPLVRDLQPVAATCSRRCATWAGWRPT